MNDFEIVRKQLPYYDGPQGESWAAVDRIEAEVERLRERVKDLAVNDFKLVLEALDRIEEANHALLSLAWRVGHEDDDLCPNCVTPWKCNGPHLSVEEEAASLVEGVKERPL